MAVVGPAQTRAGAAWLAGGPLAALVLFLGALVFAGVVASAIFQASGQSGPLSWPTMAACAAFGVACMLLVLPLRRPVLSAATAATEFAAAHSGLATAVAVGLALRLACVAVVQPQPASDGATYVGLAQQLLAGGGYGSATYRAYWPPGMAFALAPFLLTLSSIPVALTAFGLAAFAGTASGLHALSRRLQLGRWAVVPVWLLALWPTHILFTGLPEKELLLMALLPWALLLGLDGLHRPWRAAGAGVLIGIMVLVQPSLQLLPLAVLMVALVAGAGLLQSARLFGLLLVGAAVVVAPWTLRNLQVLDAPVLVTTNGGSNLYRVNNEWATGAFIPRGPVDVEALGEMESNREGKKLAVAWIRGNPGDFVQLTAGRILLFPGDNSGGVGAAFRADPDRLPRQAYLALKGGTALPWLALWATLLAATWQLRRSRHALPWGLAVVLLPYGYLSCIHAVFESGSKYHLPVMPLVFVAAVLLLHACTAVSGPASVPASASAPRKSA